MCTYYPWDLKYNCLNAFQRRAVVLFFSVSSAVNWQLSSSFNSQTLELVQFTRESARGSWRRRACAVVATRRVSARECWAKWQLRRARTHIIIQRCCCAIPDTTHCRSAHTGLTKPDCQRRKWDKVMDERIPRMQGRQFLDHADFLG